MVFHWSVVKQPLALLSYCSENKVLHKTIPPRRQCGECNRILLQIEWTFFMPFYKHRLISLLTAYGWVRTCMLVPLGNETSTLFTVIKCLKNDSIDYGDRIMFSSYKKWYSISRVAGNNESGGWSQYFCKLVTNHQCNFSGGVLWELALQIPFWLLTKNFQDNDQVIFWNSFTGFNDQGKEEERQVPKPCNLYSIGGIKC